VRGLVMAREGDGYGDGYGFGNGNVARGVWVMAGCSLYMH